MLEANLIALSYLETRRLPWYDRILLGDPEECIKLHFISLHTAHLDETNRCKSFCETELCHGI